MIYSEEKNVARPPCIQNAKIKQLVSLQDDNVLLDHLII